MSTTPENEYDFGFSFADESEALSGIQTTTTPPPPSVSPDDIAALQTKIDSVLTQNAEVYKAKLAQVEGLILPLLYNLMKNPEKVYIKWDNRTVVIQNQINKILAITRS